MKYTKDEKDMQKHLQQQISFIERSIESYDRGFEDEAQRIATIIRILLHDTANSTSLLKHLNLKSNIRFLTSAAQYIPANLLSYEGLLVSSSAGIYLPNCKANVYEGFFLGFDDWWNQIVLSDTTNLFTRRDLILNVADTDGGAHIDEKLNEAYANLTKNHSLSGKILINGETYPFRNNPVDACIRQIAFELLFSIEFHNKIISFTRKKDTNNQGIIRYIGERLYIINQNVDESPLFIDNRVDKIEKRKCFLDDILLTDKNETRILVLV